MFYPKKYGGPIEAPCHIRHHDVKRKGETRRTGEKSERAHWTAVLIPGVENQACQVDTSMLFPQRRLTYAVVEGSNQTTYHHTSVQVIASNEGGSRLV